MSTVNFLFFCLVIFQHRPSSVIERVRQMAARRSSRGANKYEVAMHPEAESLAWELRTDQTASFFYIVCIFEQQECSTLNSTFDSRSDWISCDVQVFSVWAIFIFSHSTDTSGHFSAFNITRKICASFNSSLNALNVCCQQNTRCRTIFRLPVILVLPIAQIVRKSSWYVFLAILLWSHADLEEPSLPITKTRLFRGRSRRRFWTCLTCS